MGKYYKLLLIVYLLSGVQARAQFSLGAEMGTAIPFANFSNLANVGVGGQVYGRYYLLEESLSLGLEIGFYSFGGRDFNTAFDNFRINLNPIVISGAYYFLDERFRPLIGLDLGFYRLAQRIDIGGVITVNADVSPALAPKLGVEANLNENLRFSGVLKYHLVNTEVEATTFLTASLGLSYLF